MGFALTKQIPSIQFLYENKELFKNHSLSFLPTKFVERIGDLREFDLINGISKNMEKFYELIEESTKHVKFINLPIILDVKNKVFSKIFQKDIKMQCILDINSKSPKGRIGLTRKMEEKELISQSIIQKRMVIDSHITLYASEKSAGLMFPDLNGNVDMNSLLFSSNKKFIDWCTDLFDHMWQNSHTFVEGKISEG